MIINIFIAIIVFIPGFYFLFLFVVRSTWNAAYAANKNSSILLTERLIIKLNNMSKKLLTPGTKTPVSGQYEIIGVRGGETGEEVTAVKGKPLPPTQKSGQKYKLVDKTK